MCQKMANRFLFHKTVETLSISLQYIKGFPGMAHTGAARAGVENLTKSLGQEWANFGIRVNAVAPGTIATTGLDQYPPLIQETFDEMKQNNLMKRFGTANDVANAVIF